MKAKIKIIDTDQGRFRTSRFLTKTELLSALPEERHPIRKNYIFKPDKAEEIRAEEALLLIRKYPTIRRYGEAETSPADRLEDKKYQEIQSIAARHMLPQKGMKKPDLITAILKARTDGIVPIPEDEYNEQKEKLNTTDFATWKQDFFAELNPEK